MCAVIRYTVRRCAGCHWWYETADLHPGPSGDPHCTDCLTAYTNIN